MVNTTRNTRLRFSNPSYMRKKSPQSAAFIQNAEPSMPSSNKKYHQTYQQKENQERREAHRKTIPPRKVLEPPDRHVQPPIN